MASDFKSTHSSDLKWVQIKAISNEFKLKVVSNDFKVKAVQDTSQMCPSSRYVSKGFKVTTRFKGVQGQGTSQSEFMVKLLSDEFMGMPRIKWFKFKYH